MIRNVLNIGQNRGMNSVILTTLGGGYNLVIADDVFHGMVKLRQSDNIQLVIIDIDFQTKERIDFIQHIGSSEFYRTPVIVITNPQNRKIYDQILTSGSYQLFVKPFNPIDLLNSIKSNKHGLQRRPAS